jgi:hypothetical protein
MEPTMHTGDLAIMYRRDSYDVGEIVAFEIPGGGKVIHRVTAFENGEYRFQGDNRDYADPWRVGADAIVGREVVTIPHAATVAGYLGRPPVLALLVMALTLLWWFDRTPAATDGAPATAASSRAASGTKRRHGRRLAWAASRSGRTRPVCGTAPSPIDLEPSCLPGGSAAVHIGLLLVANHSG